MKINPKSQKGAITLIVLVTMLFLIAFLISMYIRISNKAQTSAETTQEIAKKYNNIEDAQVIYDSYFATEDVIPIYTVEQLKKLGSGEQIEIEQEGKIYTFVSDGYYTLMNDLDLGGYYDEDTGTWSGEQWVPLPLEPYSFTGILDGLGNSITGLYINDSTAEYQGLFGTLNGTVKNLGVEDSYIYANSFIGTIAGTNMGNIENCYNLSEITGTFVYIGGITGRNKGRIANSNNKGNIISTYDSNAYTADIGGIAGRSDLIIENCYNEGDVNAKGINIGGITGQLKGNNAEIKNCYNIGNITSDYNLGRYSSSIGGIAGHATGNIIACYNKGNIKCAHTYVGGICGRYVYSEGKAISNSYNLGTVNDATGDNSAGTVGVLGDEGATIKYSYFLDVSASDLLSFSAGGIVTECLAKTEAEFKDIDTTNETNIINLLNYGLEIPVWVLDTENKNNGYPILSWQVE